MRRSSILAIVAVGVLAAGVAAVPITQASYQGTSGGYTNPPPGWSGHDNSPLQQGVGSMSETGGGGRPSKGPQGGSGQDRTRNCSSCNKVEDCVPPPC
jgi:hypothetical protein